MQPSKVKKHLKLIISAFKTRKENRKQLVFMHISIKLKIIMYICTTKIRKKITNMTDIHQNTEHDYIVIPNPIYDVVFKYLMEDDQSAKIILSILINEKIKKLSFMPISHAEKIPDTKTDKMIKLFHLDFTALIEKPDGEEELIMIEIQKANNAGDIFRFKQYICANFQQKQEKEIINPKTQAVEKVNKPIRLILIFILNFRIENEVNDLIIQTKRSKVGIFKEIELKNNNEFIDHLSFDMLVVQLPNLNKIKKEDYENNDYKTKLYLLLKLFDQEARNHNNRHRLLIVKKLFPKYLERVINRLKAADAEHPNLEAQMLAEDEYLTELIRRDNEISYFKEELEKTSDKLEKEKQRAEKEKQRAEEEKQRAEEAKLKELEAKQNLAKKMIEYGEAVEEIMRITNLTADEINQLL